METNESTSDAHYSGGSMPPRAGLASRALPETRSEVTAEGSHTGVSTRNALTGTAPSTSTSADTRHWYALRATYGREAKASQYLSERGILTYHPTLTTMREQNGKRRQVTESRIPNMFFAYGTEAELKSYVFDDAFLHFLRFYYRHTHASRSARRVPLIVPDHEMESLRIICSSEDPNILVSGAAIAKFAEGQLVHITDGPFKGVTGRVARYQGQQRVAVTVAEFVTACTAYVPSAFLRKLG